MAVATVARRDHTAVNPVEMLGRFTVDSATRPGKRHPVTVHPNGLVTCGCESGKRGRPCWHRVAVVEYLRVLTGATEIAGIIAPPVPASLAAVA